MKPGFQNILDVKFINNKDILEVETEFKYFDYRSNQLIVVPIGFQSDGASIPQFCWSFVGHPFQKNVRPAAILHDFLYRNRIFKRKKCDQLFYDAMIFEDVSKIKAKTFHAAVRVFGSYHYTVENSDPKIKKGETKC